MRRVLVTGGARRIGAAICEGLAADGWDLVIHCNTSRGEADALAARVRAAGGTCGVLQADLADRDAVAGLIGRAGTLDALINNASSFRYDSLATMDAASWDAHLGPNLEAPVFLAQTFAASCAGRPGCVINMLDHKVTALNPDFFSYTIAKVAMAGATRLLAQASGRHGRHGQRRGAGDHAAQRQADTGGLRARVVGAAAGSQQHAGGAGGGVPVHPGDALPERADTLCWTEGSRWWVGSGMWRSRRDAAPLARTAASVS